MRFQIHHWEREKVRCGWTCTPPLATSWQFITCDGCGGFIGDLAVEQCFQGESPGRYLHAALDLLLAAAGTGPPDMTRQGGFSTAEKQLAVGDIETVFTGVQEIIGRTFFTPQQWTVLRGMMVQAHTMGQRAAGDEQAVEQELTALVVPLQ